MCALQSLVDEKAAPDLLAFKGDVVAEVTAMAKKQVRAGPRLEGRLPCGRVGVRAPLTPPAHTRAALHTCTAARPAHVAAQTSARTPRTPTTQAEKVAAMESDPDVELERIIYERDVQRTRWLVRAYHRARVRKLEAHVQHYLHHAEYVERLSPAELDYAKTYFTSIGRCAPEDTRVRDCV